LQSNYEQSISEWNQAKRKLKDSPWVIAGLGHAYAASGRSREGHEMLNELKRLSAHRYVNPYFVARIYAGLGDRDQTFHWLGKALEEHNDSLVELKVDTQFASLHSDPRFKELIQRIGLQ
jgi:tetratricopeptide (TPR) repeat protein